MNGIGRWVVLAKCCRLALTIGGFAAAWRVVMDAHYSPGLEFTVRAPDGSVRGTDTENAHTLANAIICEAERADGVARQALVELAKAVRQVFGGGSPYGEAIAALSVRFGREVFA